MTRETTYQRLKRENKELKQDIYELIYNHNKESGMMVEKTWRIKFDSNKMAWSGSFSTIKKQ